MKKLIVIVSSLLFFACFIFEDDSVKTGIFWAQNLVDETFYKVDAQLLAENNLCYVWAEKGSGVTEKIAQGVADAYKNDIYNKMLNTFGYTVNVKYESGKIVKKNTIELINYFVKGDSEDGKLTILLMDIKDGYEKGVNDAYVAGYFWAGNLFENGSIALGGQPSNECDMIYVDTFPGVPGSKDSNETLAHELQHLMNFAGVVIWNRRQTDTWIDEGLSVTAEWVYGDGHSDQRLNCFNKDISGLIAKGNNFFVWDNRDKENQNAVLDDYSTAYLFFQWLGLQSKRDIYWKISSSEDYDYNAVINAFNEVTSGTQYSDWEPMLKDWLAANYFKSSSGRYGYGNDTVLNKIKTHYAPGGSPSIDLFPGEGVYSNVNTSTTIPTKAGNINYAGLNGSSPTSSGSIPNGGALLTYNANTKVDGNTEPGTITGAAPPAASASVLSGGRSIGVRAGPFPISAGDMLRRKGKRGAVFSGGLNFPIPDNYKGIIINE